MSMLLIALLLLILAIFSKPILTELALPEKPIRGFAGVLAVVFLGLSTIQVVSPGTNMVTVLFGKANSIPLESGIHVVNPLIETIEFNIRQTNYDAQDVTIQTQDRLSSLIDLSVNYQVIPSMSPQVYTESGTLEQAVQKHFVPALRSILREVGRSVQNAQDLINSDVQSKVQEETERRLNEYLIEKGFQVNQVMIRDIELPDVVKAAVIATKERQEQIEREKASLKVIEQQAQQQVVQAEAKAKAAEQNAIAIKTMADAEAYRIITEARATAEGNTLVAKSLTKDLVEYTEANKWNGALPTTVLSPGVTPIISTK